MHYSSFYFIFPDPNFLIHPHYPYYIVYNFAVIICLLPRGDTQKLFSQVLIIIEVSTDISNIVLFYEVVARRERNLISF